MMSRVVILLSLLLLLNSCYEKQTFFHCIDCSQLKGLKVTLHDRGRHIYFLNLEYPVGVGTGKNFEPHFKLKVNLIVDQGSIGIDDSGKNKVIWDFNKPHAKNTFFTYNGRMLSSRIDSVFVDQNEQVYACRLSNLYSRSFDNEMGNDLVMFISRNGIKGMYISRIGEGVFDKRYKEYAFYPVGETFYLSKIKLNKILAPKF